MIQSALSFFKPTELESPITEHALVLVGGDDLASYALGSAVFIAPGLAITAKHVIKEFWTQMGPETRFEGELPLVGRFSIMAVQYPGTSSDPALWLVKFVWSARFTDIAFLSVDPANELAQSYVWDSRLKISLMPPTVGERVVGFGYASSQVDLYDGARMQMTLNPSITGGGVTNVFPEYRELGMLKFPCFEISARLASNGHSHHPRVARNGMQRVLR